MERVAEAGKKRRISGKGRPMRKAFAAVIAVCLALQSHETLFAENYPTYALTIIVPFPAGGATDTLARYLGERMRPILGQASSSNVAVARSASEPRPRMC